MSGYAQEAFERSRELFEQVVAELATEDADEQTHAQLEEQVAAQGRELMRSYTRTMWTCGRYAERQPYTFPVAVVCVMPEREAAR